MSNPSFNLYSIDVSSLEFFSTQRNLVKQLTEGNVDADIITTEDQYKQIYKLRHDIIHYLICLQRNLPFGEKEMSHYFPNLKSEHWDKVKNQTPDIVHVDGRFVHITELTISKMGTQSFKNKISKYSLLRFVLTKAGYEVNLEIISLNPNPMRNDQSELINDHKLSSECLNSINTILKNSSDLLNQVHSTEDGRKWVMNLFDLDDKPKLDLNDSDVIKCFNHFDNKPFHSVGDLHHILRFKPKHYLNNDDSDFIDKVCSNAMEMKTTLNVPSTILTFDPIQIINRMSTTSEPTSILPLPYMKDNPRMDLNRRTMNDTQLLTVLSGNLMSSTDDILVTLGNSFNSTPYAVPHLSQQQRNTIALQGPGRKKYLSKSRIHREASIKNKLRSLSYATPTESVRSLSFELSFKEELKYDESMNPLINMRKISKAKGVGLDYLRCVQSIYREININSLRVERKKSFILRPTSMEGIYIIIHPGPKLRTGDIKSIIWFKIISLSSNLDFSDSLHLNNLFKKMTHDGTIWQSDWISTDASRLDHYNRCFDRCLMAYCAYLSKSYDTDLIESWNNDKSNTLGLIIMTDLENKRSTSSMLQDVRYLMMSEFSIYKYRDSIIKKMCIPMRSTLQLYYFKKAIEYLEKIDYRKMSDYFKFGHLMFNYETNTLVESRAGVLVKVPRLLTEGPDFNFDQLLCEIYFCMLFNKNQDDPTHSSFQILSKMLEGESSLKEVQNDSKYHLGYLPGVTDEALAKDLILKPHRNQFSRKAIEIGSVLQSIHPCNNLKNGLSFEKSTRKNNVNKTLDSFATFKSSSISNTLIYDPKKKVQNERRRCLEGVYEMVQKGYVKSFDLIKDNIFSTTDFHIFKKNQIGGVREILILGIEKRILINIIETISRNLCSEDDREMLTHGSSKMEAIRSMQRNLKIKAPKKHMMMHYNFDKSKWGPSFNPIQFLYLFTRFKDNMGDFIKLIIILLIQHQNKRCFFPEKLMTAWYKDDKNEKKHTLDKNLQNKKESFLEDKKTYFVNESNMGQGILHYTSSYLHLCLLSFRDEVYKRLLSRQNLKVVDSMDLLSSDDSLSTLVIPLDDIISVKKRLDLFIRATEASERLFNCWTSTTKSSVSPLIYEFNSIFGSNLTTFPTTFKFAISSVQPVSTDSFYRMVKESYNSSRQLFENGGSLELYTLSHILNKQHSEFIYDTSEFGHNSPTKLGLRLENVPYHMGYYPLFEPTKMFMFGPEYHNNCIFNKNDLNPLEDRLIWNSHKINSSTILSNIMDLITPETTLGGLLRIEAHISPSKRLDSLRNHIGADHDMLVEQLSKDPLLLFRTPNNKDELLIKVRTKLFQNSASEALRVTGPSIYYGRVSASVSAQAFNIPGEQKHCDTFLSCLNKIISLPKMNDNRNFDIIYPFRDDYQRVSMVSHPVFKLRKRNLYEVRQIRRLALSKISSKILNPLPKILEYRWSLNNNDDSKMDRDWITLKSINPFLRDSLEETMDQFNGTPKEKLSGLMLSLMRLYSIGDHVSKAFVYGPMSTDPVDTYLTLSGQNVYQNLNSENPNVDIVASNEKYDQEKLFSFYNYAVLSAYHGRPELIKLAKDEHKIPDEDFEFLLLDHKVSSNIKKRIMMVYMFMNEDNISSWSDKTDVVLHKWLKRQKKQDDGNWAGPFRLYLQIGENKMIISGDKIKFEIVVNSFRELKQLKKMLEFGITLLQVKKEQLPIKTGFGDWLMSDDVLYPTSNHVGFHMNQSNIQRVSLDINEFIVEDELSYITTDSQEPIYKVQTGLIRSYYNLQMSDDLNEKFFGLYWNDLMRLNVFEDEWDILRKGSNDILDSLTDLEVVKPKLSYVCKNRLQLPNFDEEIKNYEEVSIEMNTSMSTIMSHFMSAEVDEKDIQIDPVDQLIADFKNTEFFDGFESIQKVIKTRSIWMRLKHLKYLLISRMLIEPHKINKQSITILRNMIRGNANQTFIYWSLIKTYDLFRSTDEIMSPRGAHNIMNTEFFKKFIPELLDESDF
jgi:hypothetical protein